MKVKWHSRGIYNSVLVRLLFSTMLFNYRIVFFNDSVHNEFSISSGT